MKNEVLTDFLKKRHLAKYLSDEESELFFNISFLIMTEKKQARLDALSQIIQKYIKFKDHYVNCYHNSVEADGYYEVECKVPNVLSKKIIELSMKVQQERAKKSQEAQDKKELKSKTVAELLDALSQ